jgi:adhesin/invasin
MFTATGRGTPLLIGATVDGVPVSTTSPTVTVAAGVSPDSSVLELSSDTVAIGGSVTLTLRVIDSAGVPRTSGGETVVFTALTGAGTGQGTIDSTTDHDDGSYTANFTASGSGSPVTIGVTLAGQPMGGPPQSITILANPISPQHSTVEVADDSVAAGGTVLLTLVVRDLDSNQVTGGGLSVVFTASSDGGNSVGGIGSTTDHSDGRYTATFTGRLIGSPTTIGATINDSSLVQMLDSLGVSHLPAITVTPGPHAVDSSLFTVTPSTLTLGDSAELLLEVRDGFGNPVGQGGRNVVFARVGGAGVSVGTITGVTDSGDGTYRAFYRADSAGSADTLTATVDGVTLDSIRPTVLVSCIAGPVSVTASLLAINDATIPSGVGTTITVRVRDAVGCPITAPHAIVISATGGTSTGTIGAVSDQGDGSYTATFTGELAGTPTTLAATIDGTPISGPAVTVSVTPGDISPQTSSVQVIPAAVDSGGHASVTLQARDAAGNDLVTGGRIVTIIPTSPSPHGSLGPTTDLGNGHYAAVYTASVVEPGVPDLFTADIEGTAILSPPAGVEVVAGTISPDQSLVTTSAASVMVGDSVLVTLVGRDASGRALVTGDRVVAIGFTLAGGSSIGAFGPVQNLGNGSYAAWLTGTGAGTAVTINATIGGVAVTTGLPVVTVVP